MIKMRACHLFVFMEKYRPDLIESYPYPHIADYFDSSQMNIKAFYPAKLINHSLL